MTMTGLRSLLLALALTPALLAVVPASSRAQTLATTTQTTASALTLKSQVEIDGNLIRLSDLFDGPLAEPNRPVAEAPAPGAAVTLDANWLAAMARAVDLPWQPQTRFDQIQVVRRGQAIEPGTVKVALLQTLAQRGLTGDLDITFDGEGPHLTLPVGAEPTVAVERLTFDPTSGRFAAAVAAPAIGPAQATATISGRAYALIEVPVLKQRMTPGDTIADADIAWITMPADRVGSSVVTEIGDLVGKTPRRPIKPQQPVHGADLVEAVAVTKGSLITVALESDNLSLTVQGKAMQSGSIGDTIRVVNTMSNRVLDAVVVSPSRATVMLPTSIAQGE